jgi:hypothetical protein
MQRILLIQCFGRGFVAYYMTLWYRPNEVSSRLGITYLAGPVSGKLQCNAMQHKVQCNATGSSIMLTS